MRCPVSPPCAKIIGNSAVVGCRVFVGFDGQIKAGCLIEAARVVFQLIQMARSLRD